METSIAESKFRKKKKQKEKTFLNCSMLCLTQSMGMVWGIDVLKNVEEEEGNNSSPIGSFCKIYPNYQASDSRAFVMAAYPEGHL